ncbi:leucyl aminopeptidase, partial [Paraburkholderia aspalathi]|nr:leucyl aminopeptidase [Paraburkholderia aspalathi]
MSKHLSIKFTDFSTPDAGASIILVAKGGAFDDAAAAAAGGAAKIQKLIDISGFTGKLGATAEAIDTSENGVDRLDLVRTGHPEKRGND